GPERFDCRLASQHSVQSTATKIADDWDSVDILFNNEDVFDQAKELSPHGNDLRYEVNTLAPVALGYALKPLLERSSLPTIVNTSLDYVAKATAIDFRVLHAQQPARPSVAHAMSKVALAAVMDAFARSPSWSKIRVFSVAAGTLKTSARAEQLPVLLKALRATVNTPPEKDAAFLLQAALSPKSAYASPALIVRSVPRGLKFRLDEAGCRRVLEGLEDSESLLRDAFSSSP
ncbi:MAG: SDR family oxidoreductase, partial [Myxococcota bacterium]